MTANERHGLDGDVEKNCDNCRYYSADGQGEGDCRKHAPQPCAVRDRSGRDADNVRIVSWWPRVMHSDWCGDYEPIDGRDW